MVASCLGIDRSIGAGHQDEPFLLVARFGWVAGILSPPVFPLLHHHLPSHPGAAAGQPLDLSARVLFLQLGSVAAGCICLLAVCALFPPSAPSSLCLPVSGYYLGFLARQRP